MAPNEVAAILEKGEIVLPKKTRLTSAQSAETAEEHTPTQQVSIYIQAIDALSFMDLCKRNPGAFLGPIEKALKGNSSLRYTIKETMR